MVRYVYAVSRKPPMGGYLLIRIKNVYESSIPLNHLRCSSSDVVVRRLDSVRFSYPSKDPRHQRSTFIQKSQIRQNPPRNLYLDQEP